jgi:hypothetical protein
MAWLQVFWGPVILQAVQLAIMMIELALGVLNPPGYGATEGVRLAAAVPRLAVAVSAALKYWAVGALVTGSLAAGAVGAVFLAAGAPAAGLTAAGFIALWHVEARVLAEGLQVAGVVLAGSAAIAFLVGGGVAAVVMATQLLGVAVMCAMSAPL